MCGIAGILYADPHRPVEAAVLRAMGDAIAHRGPDAAGYWSAPGIGLVHRRLSIIDLAGGSQPMTNEDGSLQVVFNGEIYNYRQLRSPLATRGHVFRTQSDTEVLLHLYEEDGDRLVERLRGMFAFALWDSRRRTLLLARDRVGQKPLYIYRDDEKLLFGSELKAILAHPDVERQVDPRAIEDYLTWGMVPGSRAIFARAQKLPAAHVLTVSAERFDAAPRRYWQFQPAADRIRSLDQWSEAIEHKLAETVEAHRIADVPVGAFLSGGLDSSVVVSLLARSQSEPLSTYTIGFREQAFSEIPFARQTADHFGCRHVQQVVTPEAAASLDDLVYFYDEPFADSSAVATLHLARLARREVKVALSGDGGDEAFGGYSRYAHDLKEARLRQLLPGWLRRSVIGRLASRWPKADWLPRALRLKTLLTNLSLDGDAAYANTLSWCRRPLRRDLLSRELQGELADYRPESLVTQAYRQGPAGDPLSGMIAADVGVLLPDDFLTKVDRASMSCGLEVRPPLVDHELLELVAGLPAEYKICQGQSKWLFKQLYASRLPREITSRAKQGFEIPIDLWLRGPLREAFESTVLSPASPLSAWIEPSQAQRLYQAHLARRGRYGNVLWSLLVLGSWARRYLTPSDTVRDLKFAPLDLGHASSSSILASNKA